MNSRSKLAPQPSVHKQAIPEDWGMKSPDDCAISPVHFVGAARIVHRVAIVEDDAPTRAALGDAVALQSSLELACEAASHAQAELLVRAGNYDCLLIDINLGHLQSFDLIALSHSLWDAKIVVISVLGDESSVISAIAAGAHGYILKDGAFGDISVPINQVMAGEAPISPGVARHLLRRFKPAEAVSGRCSEESLSRREQQVLVEFARGASYKEVANKFDISIHTVGDYVKTLYRKLQVNSRREAVSKAVRSGMIEL